MPKLLAIRKIQLKNELQSIGAGNILVLGLFLFLIFASYKSYQKIPNAIYLSGILILICILMQLNRKDKKFIYTHLRRAHWEIYLEYFALTFPFSITSLFTRNWFHFLLLQLVLLSLPLLRYTLPKKAWFKNVSNYLPAKDYELISQFRKSFYFLIPLYLVALMMSWFKIFPLILLWLITTTLTAAYGECEPLHFLKASNQNPKTFLNKKLIRHCTYITLLYAPIVVINTIFNSDYWLLNLLFIPIQLSLLCFSICLKYSGYEPNKTLQANDALLSIISLASLLPYFLPIPFLMTFEYHYRAKQNLTNYLHDSR